jgi:hypothetical protein
MDMSGWLQAPTDLLSKKETRYPLDRILAGHQRKEKSKGKSPILPGIEPRSSSL